MELPDTSTHRRHRQMHHGKRQSKHRNHRVVHGSRALRSGHRDSRTLEATRNGHAHNDNRESLVNNWLEDIEILRSQPARKSEVVSIESSSRAPMRPKSGQGPRRSRSIDKLLSHTGQGEHDSHGFSQPGKRSREHKSLRHVQPNNSDSGLGDERDSTRVLGKVPKIVRPVSASTESYYKKGKKRSRSVSQGSVTSDVPPREHNPFAKRARHKTRSDRYDTVKVLEPHKAGKKKRKKSEHQGRGANIRKGGEFSSAREVMDRFNSESILSDRITMQPSVRPGLFDNGRASKNQLPDLTFHEMHFLKRPRPRKPLPRDRERAKRRGERELEEVSAFFLHKGLPEVSGVPVQKRPTASGSSSLDGVTSDSSISNLEAPLHEFSLSQEDGHQSPDKERDRSRETSNYTWSSSYVPLDPDTAGVSLAKEPESARSSTSLREQDALVRTGIFENTGINAIERRPKQRDGIMSRSKDISNSRVPLSVSAGKFDLRSDTPRQTVRIIRYHDRGVMAREEGEIPTERREKVTEARQDIAEHLTRETPSGNLTSADNATTRRWATEDEITSRPSADQDAGTVTAFHVADHEAGPERPRSPKLTLIEQLEAAAETVESQKSQTGLVRESTFLPIQKGVRSAPNQSDHPVLGGHSFSQQGRLNIDLGNRQLNLSEAAYKDGHLDTTINTRQDVQQACEVNLSPQAARKQTRGATNQIYLERRPAFDVPNAWSAYHEPSKTHSMARFALGNSGPFPNMRSDNDASPHMVLSDWAAPGHGQPLRNHFSFTEPAALPRDPNLSPQRSSRQQSLEEYIAEIETEVLCRPEKDEDRAGSSTPRTDELQEHDTVYLGDAPSAPHSYVDAYDRDLWEDSHLKNRLITSPHPGDWGVTHNSAADQEEQRFMSNFWRPNRY